ncbi:MAG: HD-GYP domain-containing protein [Treponema sp.]|nr:HD-GYP domain-containing protein [Treponema sp.]
MNLINTSDIQSGMVFSEPVYTEGKNLLVPALVPIRQKDIDFLTSMDIKAVKTEGIQVEIEAQAEEIIEEVEKTDAIHALEALEAELANMLDQPDFDSFAEIPQDEIVITSKKGAIRFSISDVRQNSGPYRAYKNLIDKLNAVFVGLKTGDDVEMRAVDNICTLLLQDLHDNPDTFVGFILGGEITSQELAKSSINTAILSAKTAQELKLPNHKILNIVSGALLHDVGMLRLSKGITEKKGGLSDAELEQIKSHPIHTSKIITKELYGPREVNLIALQHHERWDGQGYPDKLVGQAIDIGARIISVADAFEAMVSKKSYRNSMIGYQAIKNLMADNGRRFDPAVIIAFTKIMGIYPIGSIVRLNDTSIARVVSIHTDAPMRPVIQLLMDKNGDALGSGNVVSVNLLADRTLFIKEAIDPAEFTEQNA